MNALTITYCSVRSLVARLTNAQYSTDGHTRGDGYLGVVFGVLMVATWFTARSCPWRRRAQALYMGTCDTVGFYFTFWYAVGDIGSM